MKHRKRAMIAAIVAVACGALLSACGPAETHTHRFDETRWVQGETTHWHPAVCGHDDEKGDEAPHVYADGVCSICQKPESTETHTHAFDETRWVQGETTHWHPAVCGHDDEKGDEAPHVYSDGVCSVCQKRADGVHTDGDCLHKGYTTYRYPDGTTSVVEDGDFGPHAYEALVCNVCGGDILLEYADYFAQHGDFENDPIVLHDRLELTVFCDYQCDVRNLRVRKIVELPYLAAADEQTVRDEIRAGFNGKTAGSVCSLGIAWLSGKRASVAVTDNATLYATEAPDDDYPLDVYQQSDSPAFRAYDSARQEDFDDFAYKERTHALSVSASDQLFYAFEHGYRPEPTKNSAAERLMNEAKAVARRIMDDGMTDLEKLRAIYLWLVEDVAYDYYAYRNPINDWYKRTAYYLEGVFDHGAAVCDGISKAYCVLAGLENIKCVRVCGILLNGGGHAWNKVLVDGDGDGTKEWYVSDATWGNAGSDTWGEYLDLQYFLFTDAKRKANVAEIYSYLDTGCDAATEIDPYTLFFFDEDESAATDFVIGSDEEFAALLAAAIGRGTQDLCMTCFVTEAYCADRAAFNAAFGAALTAAGAPTDNALYAFGAQMTVGAETGYGVVCGFSA